MNDIEKIKFAISETLKLIGQPNVINHAEQAKKRAIIDLLYPKQPTQPEGYRGTFAEVVKETELQEYKKTHQLVNPLKDSSDKELLRECLDLISYYQKSYFLPNTKEANIQTQYLLTKLNKRLNHVD